MLRQAEAKNAARRAGPTSRFSIMPAERCMSKGSGAEDWNRTSDTSIFSAVLYRLSYLGTLYSRSAERSS
jgi:hypothetical protein